MCKMNSQMAKINNIVDGLLPQAKKKKLSIGFLGPLDEGMIDDLSNWINKFIILKIKTAL